jgi:hypothetical protein
MTSVYDGFDSNAIPAFPAGAATSTSRERLLHFARRHSATNTHAVIKAVGKGLEASKDSTKYLKWLSNPI